MDVFKERHGRDAKTSDLKDLSSQCRKLFMKYSSLLKLMQKRRSGN